MGLETKRPLTVEEQIARLVNNKNLHKENLEILKESLVKSKAEEVIKESVQSIDSDIINENKTNDKLTQLQEQRIKKLNKQKLATLEFDLYNKGCTRLLDSVLLEMSLNSCWIDKDIKSQNMNEWVINFKNISNLLESNFEKGETQLTKNLKEIISETAKKAAKRIKEEVSKSSSNEELADTIFQLNTDETKEFYDKLDNLSLSMIEKKVKDGVLSVVKDELKSAQDKKEKIEEINNEVEENEVSEINESLYLKHKQKKLDKVLNENVTLFETLCNYNNKNVQQEILESPSNIDSTLINDISLCESVFMYTVLEMYNTLNMYDFDLPSNVRKLMSLFK